MPLVTMASAIDFIRSSLTLQANLFQLFQPIGGVFARPLSCACTLVQHTKNKTTAISVFIVSLTSTRPSAYLFDVCVENDGYRRGRRENSLWKVTALEWFFLVLHRLTS